jgi:hypothetical protein
MSLISALVAMFCLSVFALTMLIVAVRIFQPHKRKIYAHQNVKHATDKLPYQLESYGEIDTGDGWKVDPVTGIFTKVLWDGQVVTWDNDPSGQVKSGRNVEVTGNARHNAIRSDEWMRRVNQ